MTIDDFPPVVLQQFSYSDFFRLTQWVNSREMLEQWGAWRFKFPLTTSQLYDYIKNVGGNKPCYIFRAFSPQLSEVVGHIELNYYEPDHQTASLCRLMIGPEFRKMGFCGSILIEALRFGFENLSLHRLDLQVYHFNETAISCYEKLGLVFEGRLRQLKCVNGQRWDLLWYSMLVDEWKALYRK